MIESSAPERMSVGAAMSYRYAKQDRVCIAFLGDGASEEGVFHESANFAALKKLPVIFFLENNQYSCYTGLSDRQPDRPLTDLARSYAMASEQVDGNDVIAVYEATKHAVDRATTSAIAAWLNSSPGSSAARSPRLPPASSRVAASVTLPKRH